MSPAQLTSVPAWEDRLLRTSGTPSVTVQVLEKRFANVLHSASVEPLGMAAEASGALVIAANAIV